MYIFSCLLEESIRSFFSLFSPFQSSHLYYYHTNDSAYFNFFLPLHLPVQQRCEVSKQCFFLCDGMSCHNISYYRCRHHDHQLFLHQFTTTSYRRRRGPTERARSRCLQLVSVSPSQFPCWLRTVSQYYFLGFIPFPSHLCQSISISAFVQWCIVLRKSAVWCSRSTRTTAKAKAAAFSLPQSIVDSQSTLSKIIVIVNNIIIIINNITCSTTANSAAQ